jgi:membrane protease YdiL (CAAX protease family)
MPSTPDNTANSSPTHAGEVEDRSEVNASSIDTARLARFFGVLVALAIAVVVAARAANVRLVSLAPLYMFTPAVAAAATLLTTGVSVRDVGVRVGRLRWHVLAAVSALALVGVALALALAVPGIGFNPNANPVPGIALPAGPLGLLALAALTLGLGVTVNAVFALGEELGWRGYLLWELAPLGFWRASGVIGVCWGVWHAPVILDGYNYPSFPLVGVVAMTAATVAFSPLYTYLVVRARSVLAAAFFHGVFNASAGVLLAYTTTSDPVRSELVANPVGLAGISAFVLATAVVALRGTPALTRHAMSGGGDAAGSED